MAPATRSRASSVLQETSRSLRASPVFALYALATLGVVGFIGLMVGQMTFGLDLYLPGLFGFMSHGTSEAHRTHDIVFALLVAVGAVGVLAQFRRPARNGAGMVMALLPFAAILLAAGLSGGYEIMVRRNPSRLIGPMVLVTALVHPAVRSFLRSFRLARLNRPMLALAGAAAVPLLSLASTNLRLQDTVRDEHYQLGHYGFMAAFAFTVVAVALLASLRPDGWRLTAWVAGLLSVLFGVVSILNPDSASSVGLGWALAAMAWGVLFMAVAEGAKDSPPLGPCKILRSPGAGTKGCLPRWPRRRSARFEASTGPGGGGGTRPGGMRGRKRLGHRRRPAGDHGGGRRRAWRQRWIGLVLLPHGPQRVSGRERYYLLGRLPGRPRRPAVQHQLRQP